jgi:hypothetical protein
VLQETADKFLGPQGATLPAAGIALPITKGHLAILELADRLVGEGDPEDVRSQIFQGGLTSAHRLAMDDPFLSPDWAGDLVEQVSSAQSRPKLAPKQAGQGFDVDQESVASTPPGLPIR